MIKLFPSEIVLKIGTLKTREEKIQYLRKNATIPFLALLRAMFDPNIKFYTKKIPDYKPDPAPIGMNGNSLYHTARTLYVWFENHPAKERKKDLILIQHLESLADSEAKMLECIVKKYPYYYKGLTEKLVLAAFPELYTSDIVTKFLIK